MDIRCMEFSIKGFILGDVIGMPYEGKKRGSFLCTTMRRSSYNDCHFILPIGTWSDDTSLMLGVMDVYSHKFSRRKKIHRWKRNALGFMIGMFTNHPFKIPYDIGNTCRNGFIKMLFGIKNTKAYDEKSNGNGGLMRILPIAFTDCINNEDLLEEIKFINSCSHATDLSNDCCLLYILYARQMMMKINPDIALLNVIHNFLANKTECHTALTRILNGSILSLQENEIRSTGYVVDTLESCIWSILHSTSFDDAILTAINLGGDTDTIAALTGGLAGIIYEDYNKEWWNKIKRKNKVDKMLHQFQKIS